MVTLCVIFVIAFASLPGQNPIFKQNIPAEPLIIENAISVSFIPISSLGFMSLSELL